MPRSGSRGAVSVCSTLSEYVQRQQTKCADLEQRLDAATANSNSGNNGNTKKQDEAAVNQYRMRLCESLADWIMTDAASAHRHDAVERLWKLCFYGRIGPARQKILRDKRKQKPGVQKQQEKLQAFLSEGITLFDFLCDKLMALLNVNENDDNDEDMSETQDSERPWLHEKSSNAAENRTQGVVPCLQRLYIHLGDLFRYSNQFAKAQTSYQRAAQLAPFTGHAYNQIAVTVQVQEQDGGGVAKHAAVTLFWYARSLASVRDPFTTARSNLNRLFQGNREWLKKHQQQQEKQHQQQVVLAGSASRLFLATFVDLQYDLSCSGDAAAADSTDADTTKAAITDQFYNHLTEAVASFRQLLASSALGDSLLCKLVAIAAFSEWQHQQPGKQPNAVNANSSTKTAVAAAAARTATLELGTCLAERVVAILQSKQRQSNKSASSQSQSQQSTAATATSVRVLMPLLLLTEFLMLGESGNGTRTAPSFLPVNDDSSQRLASAHRAFWMAAVEVYNMLSLQQQQQQAATLSGAVVIEARGDSPTPLLKEHQMLRGFAPFEPFLKQARPEDDELTADGYLSDAAAAQYLDAQENNNSNSQTSQQTLGSTLSSSNQEDAGRLKIQRFLGLPWTTAVEQIRACEKPAADGPFLEWVDTAAAAAPMEEEEDTGNQEDVMMDDDEDNNLLVYQQPAETGGPALLVPGALLQQQPQTDVEAMTASTTTNPAPSLPATTTTAAVPAPNTGDAASLLAGIVAGTTAAPTLPPQQESLAFPQQQQQQLQQQPLYPMQQQHQPVYPMQQQQNAAMAPPAAVLPPPGFGSGGLSMNAPRAPAPAQQMNPPFFGQLAPNFGFSSWAASANTPTIGESYQLFGGNSALETSNPFAMDTLPTFGTGSFAAHNDSAFLASSAEDTNTNSSLEGTTMLDSGLLHSLLFDDSSPRKTTTTKNPFAT